MDQPDFEENRRVLCEQKAALLEEAKALQKQYLSVRSRIADVNERLNSMVAMNLLPAETLIEIFECAIAIPTRDGPTIRVAAEWQPMLAVCRHWRKVMCSTPNLWKVIEACPNPRWLALCLERCAGVPADVSVACSARMTPILRSYSSKIRSLSIIAAEDSPDLHTTLSAPWTALEDLYVAAYQGMTASILRPERFPRLYSLSVPSCALPQDLSTFPPIRILNLHDETESLPVPRLLSIIRTLQSLEQLSVRLLEYEPARLKPFPTTRPVISLPQLKKIAIDADSYEYVSNVLAQLRVQMPSATSVKIVVTGSGEGQSRLSRLLPFDRWSAMLPSWPNAIDSAHIRFRNSDYQRPVNLQLRIHDSTKKIELNLTKNDSFPADYGTIVTRVFEDLVDMMPKNALRRLTVEGGNLELISFATWVTVLSHFPSIETIVLTGDKSAHDFWRALQPLPTTSPDPSVPASSVPCPQLMSVTALTSNRSRVSSATEYRAMGEALMSRKDHEHPLATLRIVLRSFLSPWDDEYIRKRLEDCVTQVSFQRTEMA